jgi:catechol 2,3-dioxygenase-like lactoylglutathione lyase family enzyme
MQQLLQRLDEIGRSLERSGHALALIGLGSVGLELERLDEHSDLDFFAIVEDCFKQSYLQDLSWLAAPAPLAYVFRNTRDGFKALYEDGIFCEFAVFEITELEGIPFAAGRVVWKAAHIADSIAQPAGSQPIHEFNLEHNLGEALTNLYIGLKRLKRGETLSAMRFVQGYALDRVLELADHLEPVQAGVLRDPFSRERRIEQRLPTLAAHLAGFAQGYEGIAPSALAILDWLEANFSIDPGMARAIRDSVPSTNSGTVRGHSLHMIGLIVRDMNASLEFYRRLGLAIPEGSEHKSHVEITMNNGLVFFLDSQPARWDPAVITRTQTPTLGAYGVVLEFYLETQEAVDAKHAELLAFGYSSHAAPNDVGNGMRFAFINDPDGNTVLLSGQLNKQTQ